MAEARPSSGASASAGRSSLGWSSSYSGMTYSMCAPGSVRDTAVATTQETTIGPEQLEREAAEQHLEAEERAADGRVVRRRDARGGAARDEHARLPLVDAAGASASHEPVAAPDCTSAPSRPSEAPMPTANTESTPRSSVWASRMCRFRCQIASRIARCRGRRRAGARGTR